MKVFAIFIFSVFFLGCIGGGGDFNSSIVRVVGVDEGYSIIEEMAGTPGFIIIDVRTRGEYDSGHIEGADLWDYNHMNFEKILDGFDKNHTYLVYCRTGRKSGNTAKLMQKMGFKSVIVMDGGIKDWSSRDYPLVKD